MNFKQFVSYLFSLIFRGLVFDYEKFQKIYFQKLKQMSIIETCKEPLKPF